MAGADTMAAVIGPLSTSLAGIKLFMKIIIDSQPWLIEPALTPLPWNSSLTIYPSPQTPLKIGVMYHDEVVKPHPPITRALNTVVAKLKKLPNVEVVEWKPYLHDEAWAILSSLFFTDGGAEDATVLAESGEPWRPLTTWIVKNNPCVKRLSLSELWYWQEEREAYRKEYAKVWNETAADGGRMMDVILCPAGPHVAPMHNTSKYWGYTSQWNLLDYPAVVFPVTKVDAALDDVDMDHEPMTDIDGENWGLC
jgi:amidase